MEKKIVLILSLLFLATVFLIHPAVARADGSCFCLGAGLNSASCQTAGDVAACEALGTDSGQFSGCNQLPDDVPSDCAARLAAFNANEAGSGNNCLCPVTN